MEEILSRDQSIPEFLKKYLPSYNGGTKLKCTPQIEASMDPICLNSKLGNKGDGYV